MKRFWSKVAIGGPMVCWPWIAGRFNHGYGQFLISGKPKVAHRVAYELQFGPIKEGALILHTCDNVICCNPDHLFPGTDLENARDRDAKGRSRHGPNAPGIYKMGELR